MDGEYFFPGGKQNFERTEEGKTKTMDGEIPPLPPGKYHPVPTSGYESRPYGSNRLADAKDWNLSQIYKNAKN